MSRVSLTSVSGKFHTEIDTAPIVGIVASLNIDSAKFAEWVGAMACEYHAGEHYKTPPAKAADRELKSYINALATVEKILFGYSFQSEAESGIIHQLLSNGAGLQEAVNSRKALRDTIKQELAVARRVQEITKKSAGGRPKATWRHEILNRIVLTLQEAGATAADARDRAERVLVACRITVPSSERAIRHAQRSKGDKK